MEAFRTTQLALVSYLKEAGRLRSARVERAMAAVDRKHFVQRSLPLCLVYQDVPLPIGYDETISAPHMHATCLDLLEHHAGPGARVLDVGSGSGYLTACFGLLVGDSGSVLGVEKHPELAQQSVLNIRNSNPELLETTAPLVKIVTGNVLGGVLNDQDPFDAIHVGAAAEDLPQVLVGKLKPGGRLIVPVGPRHVSQELVCVDKDLDGRVAMQSLMQVRYVPLTHPSEEGSPVPVR